MLVSAVSRIALSLGAAWCSRGMSWGMPRNEIKIHWMKCHSMGLVYDSLRFGKLWAVKHMEIHLIILIEFPNWSYICLLGTRGWLGIGSVLENPYLILFNWIAIPLDQGSYSKLIQWWFFRGQSVRKHPSWCQNHQVEMVQANLRRTLLIFVSLDVKVFFPTEMMRFQTTSQDSQVKVKQFMVLVYVGSMIFPFR